MSRVAIIDLGTNTFNLLIGNINGNQSFEKLHESKQVVKLGEGGINQGIIKPEPYNRGIEALQKHKQTIEQFGVTQVYLFATSAIRNAQNGKAFVEDVKNKFGWDIEIINGDTEATFIYYGVRQALALGKEPCLIMDIGGGSTEFIIANNQTIFWKKSYELGAARLLEKFNPSEPITETEINNIFDHLSLALKELIEEGRKHDIKILVGASGSFDSYADVILDRYYNGETLNGRTTMDIMLDEFNKTYHLFISSNKEQRMQIKGLVPMRVDMIVTASLLIKFVVSNLNIQHIRLSTYSLKEGALWYIQNNLIKK